MYQVEPDQSLWRIIKLFHQFGIWRDEEESKSRQWGRRLFHLIQNNLTLIYVLGCALISDDINQKIFLVEIGILLMVMTIKLGYLLWKKDEILQFLYDPIVTHCIANYDEWLKTNEKVKRLFKFNKVYTLLVATCFTFVIVVSLPIFTSERMLPWFIQFELVCAYDFVLYWVAFVFITASCLFYFVYNCMMILIWYIMFNYSIEYEILGKQFRSLGFTTEEKKAGKNSKSQPRNSFQQDLIGLIRAHRNLFETVERFRSCFSAMFLTEIITGGFSICASTYNLAYNSADSIFQMAYFIAVLLYAIFDIFLIMYLANEITIRSEGISYCLFESNWTDQSEKTKQCIIIFCEMIKQPQQLVIFIYPMNLEKFTSIVNGAYSMFNVLQSFNQ